ncbi:uncharacterized protein LDX57_002852 [Aspergillus melleus]|uniref:uncharacterized protein n=1 Tax=Aspergillus melleus TaxID=138277 RepID=UPI001E8CF911|nr:uncharacterized protein LDX57_002852 [Aspergillus melleus]KAH8425103.1 hypothetical protein LDX57_002852 [Aspergillus melleus]
MRLGRTVADGENCIISPLADAPLNLQDHNPALSLFHLRCCSGSPEIYPRSLTQALGSSLRPNMLLLSHILNFSLLSTIGVVYGQECEKAEDCSLNGVCSDTKTCICDPGWRASDCSELDLRPVERWTGYNHTNITLPDFYREGAGNSSWGGHIIQDREDNQLFHLVVSQMDRGCGLSGWRPFSTVIRAESRTGPRGPYTWAQELFSTFHHNPTTMWSPSDQKYLMHFIGYDWETPDTCRSIKRNNTISVSSSPDLRTWDTPTELLINVTNPAAWPLWTPKSQTPEMLLATEKNNIYLAANYTGPYTLRVEPGNIEIDPSLRSEDPFLWRDKRGHWHFLVHHMVDIALGNKGPRVGAHAFANRWEGPWHYNNITLAYNTTVKFTDGTSVDYYRRERPKLYFSTDGEMTPLYLINGVQEFNSSASYTLIQPIGSGWRKYERGLGFD